MFILGTSVEYNVPENILDLVYYSFLGPVYHFLFFLNHSNYCIWSVDLLSALPEMDPYGFLGCVSEQLKAFQSFPVPEGVY